MIPEKNPAGVIFAMKARLKLSLQQVIIYGMTGIPKNQPSIKTGLKQRECLECYKRQSKKTAKLKPYVKFTKKTVKLKVSKTYKLKIKYAKGDSVKKWKSSNKKIATVSKKGKVKAKRKGTAKITVTMKSGKKATCRIKVSPKKKSSKKKHTETV